MLHNAHCILHTKHCTLYHPNHTFGVILNDKSLTTTSWRVDITFTSRIAREVSNKRQSLWIKFPSQRAQQQHCICATGPSWPGHGGQLQREDQMFWKITCFVWIHGQDGLSHIDLWQSFCVSIMEVNCMFLQDIFYTVLLFN